MRKMKFVARALTAALALLAAAFARGEGLKSTHDSRSALGKANSQRKFSRRHTGLVWFNIDPIFPGLVSFVLVGDGLRLCRQA